MFTPKLKHYLGYTLIITALSNMDFSSTSSALKCLKRRTTVSDELRAIADRLGGALAGELSWRVLQQKTLELYPSS